MTVALLHWAQAHASDLFGWAVAGALLGGGISSWLASVRADIARQSDGGRLRKRRGWWI